MHNFFLPALILTYFPLASALPCLGKPKNVESLVDVVNYFDKDTRKSFSEYAKDTRQSPEQVAKQFAASGQIICPGAGAGTAQLVERDNLLVTSAHVFYNDKCKPAELKNCYYESLGNPKHRSKLIKKNAEIGPCLFNTKNEIDDWAILELEEPHPDAKPYRLPKAPVRGVAGQPGEYVVQVSGPVKNFPEPNVDVCASYFTREIGANNGAVHIINKCGTDHGSSGAGHLRNVGTPRNPEWEIMGMANASNKDAVDGIPFDPAKGFVNATTPISGKLYERLADRARAGGS